MAHNHPPEAEAQDGSSSEKEEGSSEENEDQDASESESEEDNTSTPLPKNPSAPKKPEPTHTSKNPRPSSSDESRSESESPNPTRRADPNTKPIASQPMEEAPTSTKKRAVESENHSNQVSKRAKKKAAEVADSAVEDDDPAAKKTGDDAKKKKQLFQRLWSEDDEIVILKGMIEYTVKKAADPEADMKAFHDFIKKSLRVEVSKTQLYYKVRRLKKKYENNVSKSASKGEENRILLKPHEQKAYELSKKIWTGVANRVGVRNGKAIVKVNGEARKNQSQRVKEGPRMEVELTKEASRPIFGRRIGESSLQAEIMKDGLELVGAPQKFELQEKWKLLRLEEVELFLKRLDLVREQTKLLLEALKSSGN